MIDTDKYEGHTEGKWIMGEHKGRPFISAVEDAETPTWVKSIARGLNPSQTADAQLIADAPLLLEAYKQIHDLLAEVLPRKDGVPHFGVTLWGLESELKRVVSEIAIIMGMAEREEE